KWGQVAQRICQLRGVLPRKDVFQLPMFCKLALKERAKSSYFHKARRISCRAKQDCYLAIFWVGQVSPAVFSYIACQRIIPTHNVKKRRLLDGICAACRKQYVPKRVDNAGRVEQRSCISVGLLCFFYQHPPKRGTRRIRL